MLSVVKVGIAAGVSRLEPGGLAIKLSKDGGVSIGLGACTGAGAEGYEVGPP